jgi:hypothetical protein
MDNCNCFEPSNIPEQDDGLSPGFETYCPPCCRMCNPCNNMGPSGDCPNFSTSRSTCFHLQRPRYERVFYNQSCPRRVSNDFCNLMPARRCPFKPFNYCKIPTAPMNYDTIYRRSYNKSSCVPALY